MEQNREQYYIVRCDKAGVFLGKIKYRVGREVCVTDARRIYRWAGATECFQLSVDGVVKPDECKFTLWVREAVLLEAIEVIPCTDKAAESLSGVKVWKM